MVEDQKPNNVDEQGTVYVAQSTPPTKPPPALETGVIAWVRNNLFSSVLNTFLTFAGLAIIIGTLVSFVTWTVQDANWFAITFNFRGFMLGRYEAPYEWRSTVAVLTVIFVMGAAVAVWIRQIARTLLIAIVVILLILLGLPPLVNSIYSLPPLFAGVGQAEIVQGSVTEQTIPQLGFLGKEGEVVTIRLVDEVVESEQTLATVSGFMDTITNTLKNAANDRLLLIDERNRLQLLLEDDISTNIPLLTASQREAYENFIDTAEIPQPVIEQYDLNEITVEVNLVDGISGDVIGDGQLLETDEDVVSFVLPHDGWFILEKSDANATATEGAGGEEASAEEAESDPLDVRGVTTIRPPETTETDDEQVQEAELDGLAVVRITGIYPILQSTSYQTESRAFVDTFIRVTDRYSTIEPVPEINGEPVPIVNIIRNQYRGDRPFSDYIRLYVSPFLERISFHTSIVLLLGVVGYAAAVLLQRVTSRLFTTQMVSYALILLPVLIWVLINGLYPTTTLMWTVLLGVGLFAIVLERIGRVRGMEEWRLRRGLPVTPLLVILGTAVVYLMLLTTEGGGAPGMLLWLTPVVLAAAALSGASIQTGEDDLRGFGFVLPLLGSIAIGAGAIVLTQFGLVDFADEWFLQPSDPRNWGGLLLTMMLTIYGIIIAFPIGVGLALGRRSDLPAIKYLCTAYIELVRGSPFITVLFFMQLLIPLISSELAEVPNSYRALIATVAFSAAYLAENVRGGLQSLPPGQLEAGKALGLSPWQTTRLITLPQALRAVIPALVGQFISLFKDTSLVAIVGLIDLTGFVNAMVVQAEFIGTRSEGLFFISAIYFVFSYLMSYVSRLLEASGSGSTRRNNL
jgi:general L-amino acid transport system permease protein